MSEAEVDRLFAMSDEEVLADARAEGVDPAALAKKWRGKFELMVPAPMFGDIIGPWHRWFAWRPVETFDGRKVWMRRVNRRRVQTKIWLPGSLDQWWQYAA